MYTDPTGLNFETPWDIINVGMGVVSFGFNIFVGNWGAAVVDLGGIAADAAAAAIPGASAVAGPTIRAAAAC